MSQSRMFLNFLQRTLKNPKKFCGHTPIFKNQPVGQAELSAALAVFLRQCRTVARSSALGTHPYHNVTSLVTEFYVIKLLVKIEKEGLTKVD